MLRRLLAPALLLSLAACASDEPQHHGRGRGGPGGPGGEHAERPTGPPRIRLFISPSGEPFRGEGGLARWFAQVDTDKDGAITLEEFRADARHSFQVLDANHDGVIDGFELQNYEHEIVPEIGIMAFDMPGAGERPKRRSMPAGSNPRIGGGGLGRDPEQLLAQQSTAAPKPAGRDGAARFSLLNEPEPIAAADTDVDGKVTLAEWMARTDVRFAKLDRAKTGKLTLEGLLKLGPEDQRKKGKDGAGGPPAKP